MKITITRREGPSFTEVIHTTTQQLGVTERRWRSMDDTARLALAKELFLKGTQIELDWE